MSSNAESLEHFVGRFLEGLNDPQKVRVFFTLCMINMQRLADGTSRVLSAGESLPFSADVVAQKKTDEIRGLFAALRTIPHFSKITGIVMTGTSDPFILLPTGRIEAAVGFSDPNQFTYEEIDEYIELSEPIGREYFDTFENFSYPLWSQMLLAFLKSA